MAAESVPRYPNWKGEDRLDPYPLYELLRQQDPVHWAPAWNAWVLTRHSDVVAAMRDPRLSRQVGRPDTDVGRFYNAQFTHQDPPHHGVARAAAAKALDSSRIENLRPGIVEVAKRHLKAVDTATGVEVMSQFARPTVVDVLRMVFDLEDHHSEQLWSLPLGPSYDLQFFDTVRRLLQERRCQPRDDVISRLISAAEDVALPESDVLATAFLLLRAGLETTVAAIGNALASLVTHPGQLALAREDPELLASRGFDELLRFEPPVHEERYSALVDVDLHGRTVGQGQAVIVSLGSANRDPTQYPDPDTLRLDRRSSASHVTFGGGIHFCLGARLARVVVPTALQALLPQIAPTLPESGGVTWADEGFRRPARLLVRVSAP